EQVRDFYQRLTPRIQALPGVEQAALIDQLPFAPSFRISRFVAEGQQPEPGKEPITQMRMAGDGFFVGVGEPRRGGGRFLREGDDRDDDSVIYRKKMLQVVSTP